MEGGEGASVTQTTARKSPIKAATTYVANAARGLAHGFANRLYGTDEGPTDPSRRDFLKRAIGMGAAAAIAFAKSTVALEAFKTGKQLVEFAHAPDYTKHEYYATATKDAHYSFTDSAVFEERDENKVVTRRYVPTGYISFGDSLAWGFVEQYDAQGRIVVDESKIKRCATDTLCADMNDAGVQTLYPVKDALGREVAKEGFGVDFEAENLAFPGATIDDIAGQISQLSKGLGEHPEQYPPIAFDAILAVGGNNALNYLGNALKLDVSTLDLPNRFKTEFIEKQFKPQMKKLIEGILALREQGKDKPFLDNMKHLIVSGVPNLGASDQLYFIPPANKEIKTPEDIPPATAIPMVPGLRSLATAACKYMNYALLDVIQEVQADVRLTDPNFEILFEDIFDVPVHGIHPTEEGYAQIAAKREHRSRAQFLMGQPDHVRDMRFSEYVTRSRILSFSTPTTPR